MVQFANANPLPMKDGITYCLNSSVPAAEGDLYNLSETSLSDPIPTLYGQSIFATAILTTVGQVSSNATYVVLQTDLGDGVWIDLAWCSWAGFGQVVFALSAGAYTANSFQQSRAVGASPGANGSNQCPLGGRVRFVGKSTINAGSSSSSASGAPVAARVQATVKYKLLGLR